MEFDPEDVRRAIREHAALMDGAHSPDAVLQRLGLLDTEEAFSDLADFSVERLQAPVRHADDVEALITVCLYHGLAIGLQLAQSAEE